MSRWTASCRRFAVIQAHTRQSVSRQAPHSSLLDIFSLSNQGTALYPHGPYSLTYPAISHVHNTLPQDPVSRQLSQPTSQNPYLKAHLISSSNLSAVLSNNVFPSKFSAQISNEVLASSMHLTYALIWPSQQHFVASSGKLRLRLRRRDVGLENIFMRTERRHGAGRAKTRCGQGEDMMREGRRHDEGRAKTRCGQGEDMMRAGRRHDEGRAKT